MSRWAVAFLCALLALPVLAVALSGFFVDAAGWAALREQASSVLPLYAGQSLLLALGVAVGVAWLGVTAAALVSLFEFRGRGWAEWALLLPMAMPAYVLAYAYTDALQFSGPVQESLRAATGRRGAMLPEVRSLWGAVVLFTLALYPYVYLLTRTALQERAVPLMETARMLGSGAWGRLFRVALPLARPAIVAGVALALMETLADYGVGAYFGLSTFTTGIYRAWLSMGDAAAAALLASVLLAVVAALLAVERRAQRRLRYAVRQPGARSSALEARPVTLSGWAGAGALVLALLPVLLGFVLPVGWLAAMLWREVVYGEFGLPWARFAGWAAWSFGLAATAALVAVALALAVGVLLRGVAATRGRPPPAMRALQWGARALSLGYAIPGAVVAIGILIPLARLQQLWPQIGLGALLTSTVAGVLYAYVLRFSSVALQSIEAGSARIPASIDETARMMGVGPWRAFWQLQRPLLQRSALAAGLLVFVDAMKELPATLALRPFGADTLAVVAYNFARDERLAEAALPSLAIVAVGLAPVLLLARAMLRR